MTPHEIAEEIKLARVSRPIQAPITPGDLLAEAEALLGKVVQDLPTIISILKELATL